ncbi:hypothetical protein NP233_g3342 [Leucocoprinus birnbaumii]|uniref:Uncharacterized protein n=1 Tax=Leucocoprinus birnbaumii TaxID=56174 RepID=A0AAD5W352_9AGAR|nr:hypothetical protein NP233_g3342 [Leucocoprinus birnbaumii]
MAFITTLLLMALNSLGPSAITVDTIIVPRFTKIPVGNLTLSDDLFTSGISQTSPNIPPTFTLDTSSKSDAAIKRANIATRLEVMENGSFGFRTKSANTLIPWPSQDLLSTNETITYKSDVVTYHFNCSWEPVIPSPKFERVWEAGNRHYALYLADSAVARRDIIPPAILSLIPLDEVVILSLLNDSAKTPPLPLNTSSTPLTAFLVAGSNTSVHDPQLLPLVLNMDNLPTEILNNTIGGNATIAALMCDPQLKLQPASIKLLQGSLEVVELHAELPLVGNIMPVAADRIFQLSLASVAAFNAQFGVLNEPSVNDILSILLTNGTGALTAMGLDREVTPLSLDKINSNLDALLMSSSKAYLSGYSGIANNSIFPSFQTIDTEAVGQLERLALGGSKPFLIALAALVGIIASFSLLIAVVVRHDQLRTFDLKNIFEVTGVYQHQKD